MATTTSSETTKPRIGIISMGDMGSGLARLLVAHDYQVFTNCTGRSQDTVSRALAAGVKILPTDEDLVCQCDLILSVVPPRDAALTARRVLTAISPLKSPENNDNEPPPRIIIRNNNKPLYFADMNAVSPATCRTIASLFQKTPGSTLRFVDGSILGGPPSPPSSSQVSTNEPPRPDPTSWTRPLLATSGPYSLSDPELDPSAGALSSVLNIKHISPEIGSASGLKMCFASLSKGYAAIAVQTVTTAHRLGVLGHLKDSLRELAPANLERMERAVVGMAPKAYRWVKEMEEISATHTIEGGFVPSGDYDEEGRGENIFDGAAGIFRFVAERTVLGAEKVPIVGSGEESGGGGGSNSNKRVRGTTSEDVARCMAEGLEEREKKRRKGE